MSKYSDVNNHEAALSMNVNRGVINSLSFNLGVKIAS